MKLKQRIHGSFLSRKSKFEAILVLQKQSGNKWKKLKPPYRIGLRLKGEVYQVDNCSTLVKSLDEREITSSSKKIKIKYKPDGHTYGNCATPRQSPIYLNADYFFENGSGQPANLINKNLFD